MSETVNGKQVFSLLEVTRSIRKTLAERYTSSFWVIAEMNKLNHYVQSGHCYPELVEKSDDRIVAQLKANLWKEDYLRINERFLKVLKEPLQNGIKILLCARITFDPVYGLSLNILDIDPSFSLGELEKEKQESLERLKKEGLFDRNKKIPFPLLPQRIAVISVETSKGYADFRSVIDDNPWGYRFFHMLFPALLQGEKAIADIRRQLARIHRVRQHFDVVAIIRGGGGDVGLSCYNNYFLARDIAVFPIPVLTGIGHATNETVSEMTACRNAITPTALAGQLIQQFHNFSVPVKEAAGNIPRLTRQRMEEEQLALKATAREVQRETRQHLYQGRNFLQQQSAAFYHLAGLFCSMERNRVRSFPSLIKHAVSQARNREQFRMYEITTGIKTLCSIQTTAIQEKLMRTSAFIPVHAQLHLRQAQTALQQSGQAVHHLSPEQTLRRGFTISRFKGAAIQSLDQLHAGDKLETQTKDGSITSIIEKTKKSASS